MDSSAVRFLAFLALAAGVFAASGCKLAAKPGPASELRTDATRGALRALCRDVEPDGNAKELLARTCACLASKRDDARLGPLVRRFCDAGGQAYFERLAAATKAEAVLIMTDDAGQPPGAADRRCADGLADAHVEMTLDLVETACREGRDDDLASHLELPEPAAGGTCWRLIRMDEQRCVVASPCRGRGPADVRALPVAAASRQVAEGAEVTLCHPVIQAMQTLKDPGLASLRYNYPFASYLAQGRSTAPVTYGAANCHGTAQAFAGGFLERLPVGSVGFHSAEVEQECGERARAAYDAAKGAAAELGASEPTGAQLPIGKGGYVVNMEHEPACDRKQCGKTSLQTFSCAGGELESYVFLEGMCINCWNDLLTEAGHKRLAAGATWRDLRSGCIMTQRDHSIAVVYINDGLCYFYESLSPFAPPQLSVAACPTLFPRFKSRWCPERELRFELR